MDISINPFQQLYFSDDIQNERNFVDLFSDKVLQTAIHPLFLGGNVILAGTQGCGKTMVLNLLRPEIRLAYHNAKVPFPVPVGLQNFLSAGINLTRSRLTDLVEVSLGKSGENDEKELPFYFSDFFNYWVVQDLLKSINIMGENPDAFDGIVNLDKLDQFIADVSNNDCWCGYFLNVETFRDFELKVRERIHFYRNWINGNLTTYTPPPEIQETKTDIGEPIGRMADSLRKYQVIGPDVPVLIRIDQVEELHRSFTSRKRQLRLLFRQMINRLFSARDARVHVRAGSRKYGITNEDFLTVWGSDSRLENRREFNLIDMDDELFTRSEIAKSTIFDELAVDAFQKRVQYYFSVSNKDLPSNLAKSVFGKSPSPVERVSQLNPDAEKSKINRVLALGTASEKNKWSDRWIEHLYKSFREGPQGMLDATLAAAWGRQTGGGQYKEEHREKDPPEDEPWKTKQWWRKERLDQAVLQLSARSQQRLMWWGFEDICSLSGGNITVFLHICHRVWDGFLKQQSSLTPQDRIDLLEGGQIKWNIQASAILFASNEWFKKLPEEPGGNSRQRFAERLGTTLNKLMMQDISMSYPGGNGVSISLKDYNSKDFLPIKRFLNECVGFGVLYDREHSTKLKDGVKRVKFYLNPILCPRFQIPEARTKEPYYWHKKDFFKLIESADVPLPKHFTKPVHDEDNSQLKLDFET